MNKMSFNPTDHEPKFRTGDLAHNFSELCIWSGCIDADNEAEVDDFISAFGVSDKHWQCGEGKRKSGLFLNYAIWVHWQNRPDHPREEPVMVTPNILHLARQYFGPDLMDHDVPEALRKPNAQIDIEWKQAA